MKIYTKTGDTGFTSLFGGARISKDDIRIEAYGTVDELNAFVGTLYDACPHDETKQILFAIQNKLFNIGSVLACDPSSDFKLEGVGAEDVALIEQSIDIMEAALAPLKNFILPSGHLLISASHVCRTVCRRAERRVVALHKTAHVDEPIAVYLNRLSDYFFVLARYFAILMNVDEIKWQS
jgi:cob(I)alamin adenosyltransferase